MGYYNNRFGILYHIIMRYSIEVGMYHIILL